MRLLDLKILLVVLLALAGPVSVFAQEDTTEAATEATSGEETQVTSAFRRRTLATPVPTVPKPTNPTVTRVFIMKPEA